METTNRQQVAANVRAELARRRMSGTQLAARLGKSQQAMSRRLTGEIPFDVDELHQLAALLDVPAATLLGEAVA